MRRTTIVILLLVCACTGRQALAAEAPPPGGDGNGREIGDTEARRRIEEAEVLFRVRRLILDTYVEKVDEDALFEGALRGMISSLDPYSAYFPAEDLKEKRIDISGRFGGLGIEITVVGGALTVITPLVDTPAFRAGVLAGDRILAIDGTPTRELSIGEAVDRMRGKPGTKVRLTVLHEGSAEPAEIEITREIIEIKSVRLASLLPAPDGAPRIGYISLVRFQPDTAEELKAALARLEAERVQALVLDLRLNPGGVLRAAVEVADLFLEEGVIVSTRGRAGRRAAAAQDDDRLFRAHRAGTRPNYPLAVLVNSGSASASEIVAGALRDNRRAVLVGEKTYGKGSVQRLMRFDLRGEEAGLLLTTAHYYTPSGRCIHEKGIEPDIAVPMGMDQLRHLVLNQRKAWIESNRPADAPPAEGGAAPDGGEKAPEPDEPEKGTEGAGKKAEPEFRDVQLDRAIDALKAILIDRARKKAA